jgi:hypothetical protein
MLEGQKGSHNAWRNYNKMFHSVRAFFPISTRRNASGAPRHSIGGDTACVKHRAWEGRAAADKAVSGVAKGITKD